MNVGRSFTFFLSFLVIFFVTVFAQAMNGRTTYQGRIIKPDGYPLEASNVSFRFTVLDPTASCVLYVEDYSSVNMSGSGGLISLTLGLGIRSFPSSGTLTFAQVFDNATAMFNCQTPGVYNPVPADNRRIVMQFNDGIGWQTLPAMAINAVPYAMYASRANDSLKLNNKADTAFVEYSALPGSCAANQALHFNGISFTCLNAGGSYTVTANDVTTALGYTPTNAASFTALSSNTSTSFTTVTNNINSVSSSVSSLATSTAASLAAITSSQWVSSGTSVFYNGGNVGVGTSAPHSSLDIQGSLAKKITMIATDTTLGSNDHIVFVESSSGTVTVTLPSAVGLLGREYYIQKSDASSNFVNIVPQAGQLLGTTDNKNLNRNGEYFSVISDGTNWNILNEKGLSYALSASGSTAVDVSGASSTVYTWLPGTGSATTATFTDLGFGSLITFGGDANNNAAGYYQVNQIISGDKEIRVSVYFNDTNSQCNDPFVMITPPGSAPVFDWNSVPGQMEFGFDCDQPVIYGTSIDSYANSYSYSGGWKTFQIIYLPSLNKSYFRVYDGRNSIMGLPLADITMNEAPWSSWQINLTADQDDPQNGQTQFADLMVSDCADPDTCGNPNYVSPAEINELIGFMPLNITGGTMTGSLNLPAGGLDVGSGDFVIATNGNVGIGTSNPNYNLDVNGTINADSFLINGSPLQQVWSKSGSIAHYNSGDVGIGTTNPIVKLDVSGAIRISMESATCSVSYAGAIRYNTGTVEFCNGTTWSSIGTGSITSAAITSALGYTPSASGVASFLVATDGSIASPTIRFSPDASTGFYRFGTNSIGVTVNNNFLARFDSAGLQVQGNISAGNQCSYKICIGSWSAPGNPIPAITDLGQVIGINRNGPGTTVLGNGLYLTAGGAPTGGSNIIGGDLILAAGISTGNATSNIELRTATGGAAGTVDSVPTVKMKILGNGNVGIGTTNPTAKLTVSGSVVTPTNEITSGGAVNLALSNTHYLSNIGGTTITLSNMVNGGVYTIIVADTTPRTYTFPGCSTAYFSPSNDDTESGAQTIYGLTTVYVGATWRCYITWSTGFVP